MKHAIEQIGPEIPLAERLNRIERRIMNLEKFVGMTKKDIPHTDEFTPPPNDGPDGQTGQ